VGRGGRCCAIDRGKEASDHVDVLLLDEIGDDSGITFLALLAAVELAIRFQHSKRRTISS